MRIGLTGGISSGKSLVSAMLRKEGVPVVDADIVARQVVERGGVAYEKIVATFGDDILLADGNIDRKKLGALIFSDDQKRRMLNEIVHPSVREKMQQAAAQYERAGHFVVALDIPLLYENDLFYLVDTVWLVSVSDETQLVRLMKRDGLTEAEAKARIDAQLPLAGKRARADVILDNEGTEEETYLQVKKALASILKKLD